MKYIQQYKNMKLLSDNAVFDFLMGSLKDTIRTYDFFVAWDKVLGNVSKIEVSLNILNSLVGKEDIDNKLKELIKDFPCVVPVLPILIAVRDLNIKIADIGGDIEYVFTPKGKYSNAEIEKIVYFATKTGILKVLADKKIKNLVDYVVGVEVGLDTNARKNRSGTVMEALIEVYVAAVCQKHGYKYLPQASAEMIKAEFGKVVPTDKADRHFDFAINTAKKIYLIEVNYYGGGGSKLKAVAGEFKSLNELIKTKKDASFLWITDGKGWLTARNPLKETFDNIDFILNINMLEKGLLEEIITNGL